MHGPVPSYLSSSSNESQSVEGLVDDTRFPPHVQDATPRLPGDLGVWLIILLELLTFAILFVSFAFARTREVELFNASQATLNLNAGALYRITPVDSLSTSVQGFNDGGYQANVTYNHSF